MLQRLAVAALALVLSSGFGLAAGPVSITVDGLQRSYLISQPATPGPKPTIIMFHGLDGTAQDVAQASGLAAMAPQAGFVAVFPSGLGGEWNHFPDGQVPASFALQAQHKGVPVPNDVEFVKALIGSLVSSNVADPHRIYLAGFSAGGFMAMRMLCVDPQAFAAIVLISTSMPTPTATDCNPTPIPAIMIKGTADDHVPYNGGLVLDKEFTVWSAPQLAAFFTQIDGMRSAGHHQFGSAQHQDQEPDRRAKLGQMHLISGDALHGRGRHPRDLSGAQSEPDDVGLLQALQPLTRSRCPPDDFASSHSARVSAALLPFLFDPCRPA